MSDFRFAYHFLTDWLHRLSVVMTYVIEIPLTFLFFAPTNFLKKLTFSAQVFLMVSIMATGNYNFFNLLFIGLCVSLSDDSWFRTQSEFAQEKNESPKLPKILEMLVNVVVVTGLGFLTVKYCYDMNKQGRKRRNSKSDFENKQISVCMAK